MRAALKKWADLWSSFPPLHKKRLYQGIGGYFLLVAAIASWVAIVSSATLDEWNSRIPHASVPLRVIFETPQLTDVSNQGFDATAQAPAAGNGLISIIISDAGLSQDATQRAVSDMPPEVALAFSPYSPDLADDIVMARAKKHEILLLLPMEPVTYPKDDPGPKALLTRNSLEDNNKNLASILSQAKAVDGVMNFMGSRFLSNADSLLPIFSELKKRGIPFVEYPSSLTSKAGSTAIMAGNIFTPGDIVIDETVTESAIRMQLRELETLAQTKGYAVGIASPLPLTFNVLKKWSDSLPERGFKIVSLQGLRQAKAMAPVVETPAPSAPAPVAPVPAVPTTTPQENTTHDQPEHHEP